MSVRADFTIGCSEDGAFVVRETLVHEYGSTASVRGSLSKHLEGLLDRTRALHAILATNLPEDAERLLLDGTRFRVDELTLRPPANVGAGDELLNAPRGL